MRFAHRRRPAGPAGTALYAVGDIHGRLDLLDQILTAIWLDVRKLPKDEKPTVIFLGDYIDRGPQSREVISRIIGLKEDSMFSIVTLRGNHEEFLLSFLEKGGNIDPSAWIDHGGRDTLASYGVEPPTRRSAVDDWRKTAAELARAMPADHLRFLEETKFMAIYGSFVFVHAGIRPNVPLDEQASEDLTNIRGPFLRSRRPSKDHVVVFGHTVFDKPLQQLGKIGLDTGAYATGRLTALRILGETTAMLTTGA